MNNNNNSKSRSGLVSILTTKREEEEEKRCFLLPELGCLATYVGYVPPVSVCLG
jgi:hypothetical protein